MVLFWKQIVRRDWSWKPHLVGNCLYSFSMQIIVAFCHQHWYRAEIMLESDVTQCSPLSVTLQTHSECITFQFWQNNHPFCQYIQILIWLWCYVFPVTHLACYCIQIISFFFIWQSFANWFCHPLTRALGTIGRCHCCKLQPRHCRFESCYQKKKKKKETFFAIHKHAMDLKVGVVSSGCFKRWFYPWRSSLANIFNHQTMGLTHVHT